MSCHKQRRAGVTMNASAQANTLLATCSLFLKTSHIGSLALNCPQESKIMAIIQEATEYGHPIHNRFKTVLTCKVLMSSFYLCTEGKKQWHAPLGLCHRDCCATASAQVLGICILCLYFLKDLTPCYITTICICSLLLIFRFLQQWRNATTLVNYFTPVCFPAKPLLTLLKMFAICCKACPLSLEDSENHENSAAKIPKATNK